MTVPGPIGSPGGVDLVSPRALPEGHLVAGRYRIERQIGMGRSAAVFAALDLDTQTRVALKMLDPLLAADPIEAERFGREVRILRQVRHPNLIKVYDAFVDEGRPFICMEYFDGPDARAHLTRTGPMGIGPFVPVARSLAAALNACHRANVVHRDLKPQNVLIDANGNVKVVDFGIAKMSELPELTRTGTVCGTPEYMAPERFRSTQAEPRSDIYALGAVMYELLTGRPPYIGGTLAAIMQLQCTTEVEPIAAQRPDVPPWLDRIVLRCLRIDPARRYQNCYELLRDLEAGAHARRTADEPEQAASCLDCGKPVLADLAFCHHCGAWLDVTLERGRFALVLQHCPDIGALVAYLERHCGLRPSGRVRTRLSRVPAVLFSWVSRPAAERIAHQLRALGCDVRVTNRLSTRQDLSVAYVGVVGMVLALPLWFGGAQLSAAACGAVAVGAELVAVLVYFGTVRPVVGTGLWPARPTASAQDSLRPMVGRLSAVGDDNVKTIVARVVRDVVRLREHDARLASMFSRDLPQVVLREALNAAEVLDRHQVVLGSTTQYDLRRRLGAVNLRLGRVQETPEAEELVGTKRTIERELANYLEIDEAYNRTYVTLFNLQAALAGFGDALAEGRPVGDWRAEVKRLTGEVAPAPLPARLGE